MSDWVNLAIGSAIIVLTASAALGGVWVGAAGDPALAPIGMAVITVSIVNVGFLVAALGIQIPASTGIRTTTKIQGRNND